MKSEIKEVRYPENLPLAVEVFKSGMTQEELAEKIGCSRQTLNQTLNGHYKGVNIVPRIKAELGIQ
jgi:DNA-binding XRE family transcriptional regulator